MNFRIVPPEQADAYYAFKDKLEKWLSMYEKGVITKLELIARIWELQEKPLSKD